MHGSSQTDVGRNLDVKCAPAKASEGKDEGNRGKVILFIRWQNTWLDLKSLTMDPISFTSANYRNNCTVEYLSLIL